MKTTVLLLFALLLSAFASAQVPVLYYDFENNALRTTLEQTPEQSVNSGSTSVDRIYSPPTPITLAAAGAGIFNLGTTSGTALSSNKWPATDPGVNTSDYLGFSTNTTGFSGLTLSLDVMSSSTGTFLAVAWGKSPLGTPPATYTASATGALSLSTSFTRLQFSLPAGAENQPYLFLKLYAYNASNNVANAVIIDNLSLNATTITASKTLLDYSALGLSQTSGTAFEPTYNNLTVTGLGTTVTLGGNLGLAGTLSLPTGTLETGTKTLTVKGTINRTNGVISAGSGTVAFSGSVAQTIATGVFSGAVKNLTINNTQGVTAATNITVSNTLDLAAGTFSLGSTTLSLGGNLTRTAGNTNAATGTVAFNGTSAQSVAAGIFTGTVNNLTVSNATTVTMNADLTLTGTLALNAGTYNTGTSTQTIKGTISKTSGTANASTGAIIFNGSVAQTIPSGTFTGGVKDLTINNTAGVSTTGNLTVGNSLALSAGTFTVGTNTLTVNGNISRTAGAVSASTGTVVFSGSVAQTIQANVFTGSVKDLAINNAAGVATTDNTTISNSLTLTAGTYDIGTGTQTISGTISRSAGSINASSGTLVLNGSAAQNIPAGSVSATIKNLTANNAAGVTINDNYTVATALSLQSGFLALNGKTLTLGGTVAGTGKLRGSSASGLSVASVGAVGTLNFDQATDGTTNALSSMAVSSGSATLGSKLNVYTVLNITGGTFDLAAKNLVLKSNATQTAYVAEIKGSLTGETNVTVERYIPAWSSRRWRLVTAPVSNTTINAAWQEGSTWNGTTTIPATGTGTLITGQQQGTAATANAKGFDFWTAIANGSASLRSYAAATSSSQASWQPVSSTLTTTAFNSNQAYLLFVRGDRSVYSGTAAGATTLRPTGTLKQGTFTVSVARANSHTLIGNPYASPLDFKAVYDANDTRIQSSFYIWQSSLGSSGGYVLMRPITPGSSQYEAIPGNGSQTPANRYIHSGEGFFVMPAATAAADNAITIKESQKSTATPGISVFRLSGTADAKLYVNLYDATDNANPVLVDGTLTQYNDSYLLTAGDNMVKAVNSSENFSIQKTSGDYIVASGADPRLGDTLKFRMWNTTGKPYQLELKTVNFTGTGLAPVLGDRYLKKETPLDPNDATTTYAFNVTSDAASKDPSRFYVAFRTAIALPLSITGIKAEAKDARQVTVQWTVADETECKNYQVERSVDAATFVPLGTVEKTAGSGEKTYTFLDSQPAAVDYYRVKLLGNNGEVKYSAIVKLQLQTGNETVAVYPNPVAGNGFNLLLQNRQEGTYTIALYNSAGQAVLRKTVQYTGGTLSEMLTLPPGTGAGIYHLDLKDSAGRQTVQNLQVIR